MRSGAHFGAACLGASLGLLAMGSPAAATPRRITGRLSESGYTVIALASDGAASSVTVRRHRFRLRPPAGRVTLHLRAENGKYAGPIVTARNRRKKRAIVGVKAGARLGAIKVSRRDARVRSTVAERWIDKKRWARAKRGHTIGNGRNFGSVRSALPVLSPPGDRDADGVPDTIDIDVNGNLILNRFDRAGSGAGRVAQVQTQDNVGARSYLALDLSQTVNANAAGFDLAQVNDRLQNFGALLLGSTDVPADPGTDVELDCGDPDTGLVYCRQNGSTGTISGYGWLTPPGHSIGDSFPSCCDLDRDGMGSLVRDTMGTSIAAIGLLHGATSDQVVAGQLLRVAFIRQGAPDEVWGTLSYIYVTVPAVVSYTDEDGTQVPISYPVAPGAPGTQQNPFVVPDGPDADGDVQLALTFWRPQRKARPDEVGEWTDIGHSLYGASVQGAGNPGTCPASAYSALASLTPAEMPTDGADLVDGLLDASDDQPSNPSNTLGFTVDLTKCLATGGDAFEPGDEVSLTLRGQPVNTLPGPPDNARTTIWFKHQ